MEKCAIFIDGGYLNRINRDYFDSSSIDYLKLCDEICNTLKLTRLRTYYYNSMPIIRKGNKEDEKKHSKMQLFFASLKRLPRFEVKLGRLQLIGGQFKQKMIDVLMSLDIVSMCFDNQIQQAILIAGDSDFIPAIKKAKDCGAIIHLFYHPKSVHNEMLDEVDELHILSEELINKCRKRSL
ncbi:MAG: NYN domain-containing protein [Nanoarchaeota archaeon]